MSDRRRRTDIIADPSFAAAPGELDSTTLRSRRRLCLEVERELSYQRRLLHGRLDLIDFEQRRRRGEVAGNAVESLGEILDAGSAGEESDHASAGEGRQVTDTLSTDPIVLDRPGRRDVDLVIDDDTMSRLDEMTDDALDGARARIEEIERVISAQRRTVHHAEALLAAELAERYRSGTISTDELITG
jgi:hypothetical protein